MQKINVSTLCVVIVTWRAQNSHMHWYQIHPGNGVIRLGNYRGGQLKLYYYIMVWIILVKVGSNQS